jgi:Alginate export
MEPYAQNPEQLKAICHQGATVARAAAALSGKDLLAHSNEAHRRELAKQFLDIKPTSLYNSRQMLRRKAGADRLRNRETGRVFILVLGLCAMAITICPTPARTQVIRPDKEVPSPPAYKLLRYEEDYRKLRAQGQSSARDLWDPLKYIPLNAEGDAYLSIGGELRERYEAFNQPFFGLLKLTSTDYILHRALLHLDAHFGRDFRVFLQLGNFLVPGKEGPRAPTDYDELEFQQAFADINFDLGGTSTLTFRGGRQEFNFGAGRLVSVREGPNIRQSFDGIRAIWKSDEVSVDAFLVRPVRLLPGVFDDRSNENDRFWGVIATVPMGLTPNGRADLYYFGLERKNAIFDSGIGAQMRHSFGVRLFGNPTPFDYDIELVAQTGNFSGQAIWAWTAASDLGVTFEALLFKPRLGLRLNVASGDSNRGDGVLGTFDPLYPNLSYFSEAGFVSPSNFFDIHPSVQLALTPDVSLETDWDFLWRQTTGDGLYIPPGVPLIAGGTSTDPYIGNQISVAAEWRIERHTALTVNYTHFAAGETILKAGGRSADYFAAWLTYKF